MMATQLSNAPAEPAILFAEEIDDLLRDAKMLSCAPREAIEHNREWIEEGRELLNDALAKVAA